MTLPTVSISADTASAVEGGLLSYTVTRTGDGSDTLPVSVFLTGTGANPASPGSDVNAPLAVTFLPGETSKTISFQALLDSVAEPTETFSVSLMSSPDYTIGTSAAAFSITDKPVPTVSISADLASVLEGGTTTLTLTRTGDLSEGTAVQIMTGSGSGAAIAGSDFFTFGQVYFAPGETTRTVQVFTVADQTTEGPETATFTLAPQPTFRVSPSAGSASVQILDPGAPTVSIAANPSSMAEGFNSSQPASFTITLDHAVGYGVQVNYGAINGTATGGEDFSNFSGSVFFAAGETSKIVSVPVFGDTKAEADETFTVSLSNPIGFSGLAPVVSSSAGSATFTITNDDVTPVVSIRAIDGHSFESNAGDQIIFLLERTGDLTQSLSVPLSYAPFGPSGATVNSDFGGQSSTNAPTAAFFQAGSATATVFLYSKDDAAAEGTEQFSVTVGSGSTYAVSPSNGSAVGTIIDDETAGSASPSTLSLSGVDTSALEGGFLSFKITRTGDLSTGVTASLSTLAPGGSGIAGAGSDFIAPFTARMLAGETERTFTIVVNKDALTENTETFGLKLNTSGNYTVDAASGQPTFTITDVPPAVVSISSATASADEGSPLAYTVTRTGGDLSAGLSVNLTVAGSGASPATPGTDFFAPLNVVFAPNETSRTISVSTLVDTAPESTETFTLSFQTGPNYVANSTSNSATFSILNVAPPVVSIAAVSPTITEGNDGQTLASFTISLDHAVGYGVSVAYNPESGTATVGAGTAGQQQDVSSGIGSTFFAPGETTKTVSVSVFGDLLAEADETFSVRLTSASSSGAPQSPVLSSTASVATMTIVNDDPMPVVSVQAMDGVAKEGNFHSFLATRTGDLSTFLFVPYTIVAGGTNAATPGSDIPSSGSSIYFAPGSATASFGVMSSTDSVVEPNETFAVTLTPGTGYAVSSTDGSATGTILDGPPPSSLPTVSLAAGIATAAEGGQLSYIVSRTGDTSSALTVNLGVAGSGPNPATPGQDFFVPLTATIAAGQTSTNVAFSAFTDSVVEPTEGFTLSLNSSSAYAVSTSAGSASFSITDVPPSSLPTVSIAAGTASATEGSQLSYVVSRSGDTSGALTVNLNVAGSGTNPATPGTDFFAPLTVNFAAGETSKTAFITTYADSTVEPTETFTLSIPASQSYSVGTGSATFSILDGPSSTPTVSVAATDGAATEGAVGDSLVFTFTRTGSTSQSLSVNFTTGPTGTFGATPSQDYPAGATGTVFFAAGSATATLTLFPNDDFLVEPTETFRVAVAAGTGYVASTTNGSATGAITDNDTNVLNLWRTPDTIAQAGQHYYRPNALSFSGTQEWVYTTTPAAGYSPTGDEQITLSLRGQDKFGSYDETPTSVATYMGPSELGGGHGLLLFAQSGSTLSGGVFWMERSGTDLDLKYRTYTVDANGISAPGAGTTLTGSTVTLLSGLSGVGPYYDWITATNSSSFAFAYERITGATKDIILRGFNPDGTAIGPPITVVSGLPAAAQWSSVVANSFGILYEGTNGTNATFNLRSVDAATGTVSGGSAHVTDLTDITSLKPQTPLASGFMYSATGTKAGATNSVIEFYQIDASDNDVGTGPRFSFDLAGSQVASRVLSTGIGGGDAIVAYSDPNDATVHLVRIDQTGTLIGNLTVPGLTQFDRIRGFGDGRVEVEYRETVSGGENVVKTLIYDVRSNPLNVVGSANSDVIAGTIFVDTINGGAGADDLYGAGGIDKFASTPTDLAGDTIRDIAPGETITLNGGWTVDNATLTNGVLTVGYHATAGGAAQNLTMNLPNADGRVAFSGNVVSYLAPLPSLSIAALNADRAEGSAGATPFTFRVTRTGDTSVASNATYTVGGMAVDGSDFAGGSLPTGSVAFAVGETTKTVTIGVAGDSIFEADEAFTVTLSSPAGATIAAASATGTIRNDDLALPSVSLSAGTASAAEGGQLSYVVTRAGSTAGPLTVNLGVVGSGTDPATPGQDFFVPLTATIAAGQTSATVSFSAFADSLTEPTEGLTLNLASSSAYTIASGAGSASFAITDTPAANFPAVSLTAGTASAAEGGQLSYTVTRTGDTSGALTVNLGVVGSGADPATPGTDFYVPLTATIPAGQTSATVTFSAFVDSLAEPTETFTLSLNRSPNYVVANGAGTAGFSITDGAAPPPPPPQLPTISVIASDASGTEGPAGDDITFTFYRSGDATGALAVNYNLVGAGTNAATPGVDTSGPASGTVTFAAGSTTATLTLPIVDDTLPEVREGIAAVVASGSGYQVASSGSVATAYINDNDATAPLPTVTVAASDASAVEGAAGDTIVFTFSRTGDASSSLTVNVATIGSGPNPASASDHDGPFSGGIVTFAAGSTTATLVVTPVNDTLVEPSEGLAVIVQGGSGYQVGDANVATATIVDDDATAPLPTVTVSTSDGRAVEGAAGDTIAFTFQRTGSVSDPLTVNFASGGIGQNPASSADHDAPASGTVTFAAGSATATLVVTPADDSFVEPSEGLFVKVTGGTGYQLGQSNTIATATIADDDTPALPSLSIGDVTVTENLAFVGYADNPYNGGTTANPDGGFYNILFKVTLSAASSQPVTVAYSTPTTLQGPDGAGYIDTNGTITFQPGETEKTIRVVGIDDFNPEDTKVFAVSLSGAANATIAKGQGFATVYDDDIAGGQAGRAVDGYIAGATVFADANNNGTLDSGEATATTDATGSFVLTGGSGTIILFGGTDTATGLPFKGMLKAVGGSTVVTPLTTLVAAIAATGATAQEAEATAKAALGLPAATSIGSFDPIAAATTGDAVGQAAFVAGLKVINTAALVASTVAGGSGDYDAAFGSALAALAGKITDPNTPITIADLASGQTVQSLVTTTAAAQSVTLDAAVVQAATQTIANLNTAVDTAAQGGGTTLLADTSAVARVALGNASTALAAASDDPAQAGAVTQSYSGTALAQAVTDAQSQTGDLDGPNVQSAPIGRADSYNALSGAPLTRTAANGVLANDVDPDGSAITAVLGDAPDHGALLFNADGSFTYAATAGFVGSDSFTYQVSDGSLASPDVTVSLVVGLRPIPGDGTDNTFLLDTPGYAADGAGGSDTASFANRTAPVVVTLNGPTDATVTVGGAIDGTLRNVENLVGGSGADALTGDAFGNRLDGGVGADTMTGRGGNDTYVVDNLGDVVIEGANAGTDLVYSSVTFSLTGYDIENLTLTGQDLINGTGNSLNNVLVGNGSANILDGGAYRGVSGNDTLDGGGGADIMRGRGGNDTYIVDNAGDQVIEGDNEGVDLVRSSVTFSLSGQQIENLTLTGTDAINGTGNSLNNVLVGNEGANVLDGGVYKGVSGNDTLDGGIGADIMRGRGGNDTYIVDNAGDQVIEGDNDGVDLVRSSVTFSLSGQQIENLTLTGTATIDGTGNSLDNVIVGNSAANVLNGGVYKGVSGNDTIDGGAGNDTIDGGLGTDSLTGGEGQDTFVFSTTLGAGNVDKITFFYAPDDSIQLSQAIFAAIPAGPLAATAFKDIAAAGAAVDGDDRIIYNHNTGVLSYDDDGSGADAAVVFATLVNKPIITAADFFVV